MIKRRDLKQRRYYYISEKPDSPLSETGHIYYVRAQRRDTLFLDIFTPNSECEYEKGRMDLSIDPWFLEILNPLDLEDIVESRATSRVVKKALKHFHSHSAPSQP